MVVHAGRRGRRTSSNTSRAHGFLQAFAGFHEAGEGGIHGARSGSAAEWPSSARSPRCTSMITAGSVRGKCCGVAVRAVHDVAGAARLAGAAADAAEAVPARQCIRPRACARTERVAARQRAGARRADRRTRPAGRQQRQRVLGGADIDGEHRRCRPCRPRNAQGAARAMRSVRRPASPVMNTASGLPSSMPRIRLRAAPDRREQRVRVGQARRRSRPSSVAPCRRRGRAGCRCRRWGGWRGSGSCAASRQGGRRPCHGGGRQRGNRDADAGGVAADACSGQI